MKPIGLASDHAGFELKSFVCRYLDERGIPYVDFGTHSSDSCDYPDFGHALGRAIDGEECERGIAVCGSGEGISMTLNKHAHRPVLDARNSGLVSSTQQRQRSGHARSFCR